SSPSDSTPPSSTTSEFIPPGVATPATPFVPPPSVPFPVVPVPSSATDEMPAASMPILSQGFQRVPGVDLTAAEALSDLPDESRDQLAMAAEVVDLARDDEIA